VNCLQDLIEILSKVFKMSTKQAYAVPELFVAWSKFTDPMSRPTFETFPQLPSCVATVRLVVGLLYGISLGYRDMIGGFGLLSGASAVMFFPLVYVEQFLKAETSTYPSNVAMVGVVNAFALLILVWVTIYTMNHPDLEAKMIITMNDEDNSISDNAAILESTAVEQENEF